MNISSDQLTGLYISYKKWELIWLENKKLDKKVSFNYFDFSDLLHKKFPDEKCKKILEHINCGDRKVILDFDKIEAKVVIQKDEPFENALMPYFKPSFIENVISNPEEYADLYVRSNADIRNL